MQSAGADEIAYVPVTGPEASGAAGSRAIALAGPLARATLALRQARALGEPALLVTAALESVRAAIRAEPALGRRALIVAGALDSAELGLRLREISGGAPALVVVEPDRLWQARMVRALRAYMPRLVLLEISCLGVDARERAALAETLLRWARDLFPGATVLALHQPLPRPAATRIAALLDASPEQQPPLLPDRVALRVRALEQERERLSSLLSALRAAGGPALAIVPSRGKARTLAGALTRAGLDAALYHGGLSASERTAVLSAWREGRQPMLVATEAIAIVPDLSCPDLIAFSHPPRSPDTLLLLAERAERAAGAVTVLVTHTDHDLAVLPDVATASAPALGRLRRLYAALRRQSRRGQIVLDPERLTETLGEGAPATHARIRLELALLVQSGYLVRRADFARAATITASGDDSAALAPLDAVIPLRAGVPVPVDPLHVATALAWQPHRLHQWLLDAEGSGLLTLRTIGREMLLTLRSPPPDGGQALATLVDRLRQDALADAAATVALLRTTTCRVQALARALGWTVGAPCGRCDRCAPGGAAAHATTGSAARPLVVVLHALAMVPRGLPRRAALRVARQALGAQGAPPAIEPADAVDALLARGLLVERQGDLGPILVLTEAGTGWLASAPATWG